MPYVRAFEPTARAIAKEISNSAAPEALAARDVILATSSTRDTIAALEGRSTTSSKWYRTATLTRTAVKACSDLLSAEESAYKALSMYVNKNYQKSVESEYTAARKVYEDCIALDSTVLTRLTWQRLTYYYNDMSPVLDRMKSYAETFLAAADATNDKATFRVCESAASAFINAVLDLTAPDMEKAKDREHTDGLTMSINRHYRTPIKALKDDYIGAFKRFADRTRPAVPETMQEDTQKTFEDLPDAGSTATTAATVTQGDNSSSNEESQKVPPDLYNQFEQLVYEIETFLDDGTEKSRMKRIRSLTNEMMKYRRAPLSPAGRPPDPTPRKRYSFVLTEDQYKFVKEFLKNIRGY